MPLLAGALHTMQQRTSGDQNKFFTFVSGELREVLAVLARRQRSVTAVCLSGDSPWQLCGQRSIGFFEQS